MNYAEHLSNLTDWLVKQNLNKLNGPVELYFSSYDINGFYHPLKNAISIIFKFIHLFVYNYNTAN